VRKKSPAGTSSNVIPANSPSMIMSSSRSIATVASAAGMLMRPSRAITSGLIASPARSGSTMFPMNPMQVA
jgi:hypothetical protein